MENVSGHFTMTPLTGKTKACCLRDSQRNVDMKKILASYLQLFQIALFLVSLSIILRCYCAADNTRNTKEIIHQRVK